MAIFLCTNPITLSCSFPFFRKSKKECKVGHLILTEIMPNGCRFFLNERWSRVYPSSIVDNHFVKWNGTNVQIDDAIQVYEDSLKKDRS